MHRHRAYRDMLCPNKLSWSRCRPTPSIELVIIGEFGIGHRRTRGRRPLTGGITGFDVIQDVRFGNQQRVRMTKKWKQLVSGLGPVLILFAVGHHYESVGTDVFFVICLIILVWEVVDWRFMRPRERQAAIFARFNARRVYTRVNCTVSIQFLRSDGELA